MEIKRIKLDDLKPADKFLLSFPLKPELYHDLWEKFAPVPLIIVNREEEIVFGIDFYRLLESQMIVETDVLQMEIPDKEALMLNYNLKEKFTGVNVYEKLVFIKRMMPLVKGSEIYQKTGLDIPINRELVEKLDLLLSTVFRDALVNEHINLKTGLKLCDFPPEDTGALLELFTNLPFSSSHQLKILEITEEILSRDKCGLEEIFDQLEIKRFMDLERPQKKIIDELFKYRCPLYIEAEEKWQKEIKAINLPDNVKVSHYPFFEKKQLEITIRVQDLEAVEEIIRRLRDVLPEGRKSHF